MIISLRHRYVFVHIPKTGGTSLSLALEAKVGKDDILIGDTPKAVKRRGRVAKVNAAGRLWKHSKLADVDGVLPRETLSDYTVFAVTRNPWDRFVSYYHWLREQSFNHALVKLAKAVDFQTFLGNPAVQKSIQGDQTRDYLSDVFGEYRGDLVLQLEQLEQDLVRLEALLGIKLGNIPHTNTSQRPKGYRAFYTDESAGVIARAYADDIKLFGYSF